MNGSFERGASGLRPIGFGRAMRAVEIATIGFLMSRSAQGSADLPTIKAEIGVTRPEDMKGLLHQRGTQAGLKSIWPDGAVVVGTRDRFNLEYVYHDRTLLVRGIGGDKTYNVFNFSRGRHDLSGMTISLYNDYMTSDEAVSVSEKFYRWFISAGFKPGPKGDGSPRIGLGSEIWDSRLPPFYRISTFTDIRRALRDEGLGISQLGVFNLRGNNVNVSVDILNGRRIRENTGGFAINEPAIGAREYYARLNIVRFTAPVY